MTARNRSEEMAEVSLKMPPHRRRKIRRIFPKGHDRLTPGPQDRAFSKRKLLGGSAMEPERGRQWVQPKQGTLDKGRLRNSDSGDGRGKEEG